MNWDGRDKFFAFIFVIAVGEFMAAAVRRFWLMVVAALGIGAAAVIEKPSVVSSQLPLRWKRLTARVKLANARPLWV